MAFGRVSAPVNNEIGSVFDFAQRACDFTTQLGGDFGWAVSQGGVAVEQRAQLIGQRDALTLSFTGGVAHAVNQRHVGVVKEIGRRLDRFVDRRLFAVDQGIGVFVFGGVIEEPGFAEHARFFRLMDPDVVGVKLNVVANTPAEGACRVVDYFEIHRAASRGKGWFKSRIRPNRTKER